MTETLSAKWLGRIGYDSSLQLQVSLLNEKVSGDPANHLLLLEHEPVYTIGRNRDDSSLGQETLLPHPVQRTNRGGQATYHGPGQLVGYPILDLTLFRRDLHEYLRFLEDVLISFMRRHDVEGKHVEGKTGVWVNDRKIASLGVGVRKWISMHGFAINICGDLTPFNHITPCGLPGVEMTSLEAEGVRNVSVESSAHEVAEIFNELLNGRKSTVVVQGS